MATAMLFNNYSLVTDMDIDTSHRITDLQQGKTANELLGFFTSSKTAALFTFSLAMSQIFKIPRANAFIAGSSMKSGL